MSIHYRKHGLDPKREYTPHGRTVQSQKSETDINKILERAGRANSLSHLEKYQAKYGDYSGWDFEEHMTKMAEGQSIFEELPAEVKREFDQSPTKFFDFVNDPKNIDKLPKVLPMIAARGNYFGPVSPILHAKPEGAARPDGEAVASPPAAAGGNPVPQDKNPTSESV